jgi:FMN phosphatase YigB (HAD superfamily)
MKPIEMVFFDIGNTLVERKNGQFVPLRGIVGLLTRIRDDLDLRIGVITTLGDFTNEQGLSLLNEAGLDGFLDPDGFVSEHDTGEVGKPAAAIYEHAAQKAGLPIGNCLFVGENLLEVIGAKAAGMQALLKPFPPGAEVQ